MSEEASPFAALGLREELVRAVAEAGYTEPTPIQTQAIPVVLAGRAAMIGVHTARQAWRGARVEAHRLLNPIWGRVGRAASPI